MHTSKFPIYQFILLGLIAGSVQPAFAIVFAKAITVFSECDINVQRQNINLYCLLFVMFGVINFLKVTNFNLN